jgi:hypothetical protein
MAPRYVPARLHGGPLDRQLVHAPIDHTKLPAHVMSLPVPVLDEQTETFGWDTANYVRMSLRSGWRPGDPWDFANARTLPGYPTYTQEAASLDLRSNSSRDNERLLSKGGHQVGGVGLAQGLAVDPRALCHTGPARRRPQGAPAPPVDPSPGPLGLDIPGA